MRRVREVLRYRFEDRLGHKSIAVRVGAVPSSVCETLCRVEIAGLSGVRTRAVRNRTRPLSTKDSKVLVRQ